LAPGSAGPRGAFELILGSALRIALRATLLRAWTLRSGRWLAVSAVILVLRAIQRTLSSAGRQSQSDT